MVQWLLSYERGMSATGKNVALTQKVFWRFIWTQNICRTLVALNARDPFRWSSVTVVLFDPLDRSDSRYNGVGPLHWTLLTFNFISPVFQQLVIGPSSDVALRRGALYLSRKVKCFSIGRFRRPTSTALPPSTVP